MAVGCLLELVRRDRVNYNFDVLSRGQRLPVRVEVVFLQVVLISVGLPVLHLRELIQILVHIFAIHVLRRRLVVRLPVLVDRDLDIGSLWATDVDHVPVGAVVAPVVCVLSEECSLTSHELAWVNLLRSGSLARLGQVRIDAFKDVCKPGVIVELRDALVWGPEMMVVPLGLSLPELDWLPVYVESYGRLCARRVRHGVAAAHMMSFLLPLTSQIVFRVLVNQILLVVLCLDLYIVHFVVIVVFYLLVTIVVKLSLFIRAELILGLLLLLRVSSGLLPHTAVNKKRKT